MLACMAVENATTTALPSTTPETSSSTDIAERSDITCGAHSIHVKVPHSLLGQSSDFSLVDPSCSVTVTSDSVTADFNLNACGTTARFTDTSIVYTNYLTDKGTGLVVPLECTYPRSRVLTSTFQVVQTKISFYEKGTGSLNIEMKRYGDMQFGTPILNSNAPVRQGDTVFIGLSASSQSVNLATFPGMCVTTPSPTPLDASFSHVLIDHGCKRDTSVVIYEPKDGEFRFSFDASAFAGKTGVVYVHCDVQLCQGAPDAVTRCSQGCVTHNGRTRRSVAGSPARDGHYVSGGPFLSKADDHKSSDGGWIVALTSSVAVVSMLVATVAVAVAVVSLRARRVKQYMHVGSEQQS